MRPLIGRIEDGVEIPPSKRGQGLLKPHMERLAVGQSFETSYSNSAVHRAAKELDIRVETRRLSTGVMRVWRVV